jgi:hypothetical protein
MRDPELYEDRDWACADEDAEAAVRESEAPCWLCGRAQEHAGVEPDATWDWSEYDSSARRGEEHGPVCPTCTRENA